MSVLPTRAAELSPGTVATSTVESIDEAVLDRLSGHPTWRRLLHVERAGNRSRVTPAIVTPAFYLTSSSPLLSPHDELVATLEAFGRATPDESSRVAKVPADDPQCRFPARLHWLSHRLPDTIGALPRVECPALNSWLDIDAIDALSLIHVSGHFSNPASAFGHLLLRVESVGPGSVRGLLDLGINFGAVVPPQDGPLVYVLKGLFGGYQAGFTDQSFHVHDAVYSATEQRDMWAYQLNLDADQRRFLLLHLWELRQARFTYYFLRHNCAWYLSALLELVLEQPIRERRPWQLPSAVFGRIDQLKGADGLPLVTKVSFVPSLERQFLHGFAELDATEARHANALIRSGPVTDVPESVEPSLERPPDDLQRPPDDGLADASRAELDVLLNWAELGTIGSDGDERTSWQRRRRALLIERLSREPGPPRASLPPAPPPARGPRSLTVAIGAARDVGMADDGTGDAVGIATLRLAPFARDLLDANRANLRDADFRLGDLLLGIGTDEGVHFRSLDLIAAEKLAVPPVVIADRPRRTWRMALRLNGERSDCVNCSSFVAKGGIGLADTTTLGSSRLVPYAYVDVELGSTRSLIGPSLGVLYRSSARLALRLESRWLATSEGEAARVARLDATADLGAGFSMSLSASDVDGETNIASAIVRRF